MAERGFKCHVVGLTNEIIQIGQQLAWLGSALQHAPSGEVAYSNVRVSSDAIEKLYFNLTFDISPLEKDPKGCWYGLFSTAVIAKGFPITARTKEIGLEIPLQMMAALGGVRHAVSLEGGLILKGYSCAFVPVMRYEDSIQWHFSENDSEDRLPYWEVEAQYPNRAGLQDVNLETLASTRAFVGWWGTTETHLGTEEADYGNIDYSSAGDVGKSVQFDGISLGFQQLVTGEANFRLGTRDGKLHIERRGPYQKIIRCSAKTPVLLYDHDDKRAWLVPSSAVILHIAKTRHFREPYTKGGKLISFPFASPQKSRHASAEELLLEHASLELSDSEDFLSQSYYLKDVVSDIWSRLETLLDMNVRKERASEQDIRMPMKHFLRGWEFMALVEDISPLREKETSIQRSSGNWTRLTRDIDAVVLFASGFGDIIRPSDEACSLGLCKKWNSVPKGKDYLAASIPMMIQLFDRAGSRVSRKHLTSTHLRWNPGQILWEPCENSKSYHCNCDRVQGIVQNSTDILSTITEPDSLEKDGAVIFGQTSHPFSISKSLVKPQQLYSQENVGFLSEHSAQSNKVIDFKQSSIHSPVSAILSPAAKRSTGSDDSSTLEPLPSETSQSISERKQPLLLKETKEEKHEQEIQIPYYPPKRLEQIVEIGIPIENSSTLPQPSRSHSASIDNDRELRLRRKGKFKRQKNDMDCVICCDNNNDVDIKALEVAEVIEYMGTGSSLL